MKILLISINDLKEQTGGGIYLRTIYELYKLTNNEISLFSKNSKDFTVRKNALTDIIGRLFLCPSYIGFYVLRLIVLSFKYDCVAIHSSRLGTIAKVLKFFRPNLKVVIHSDNVETILIKSLTVHGGLPRKIINYLDKMLMPMSERLCSKYSDVLTFITKEDENTFRELGLLASDVTTEVVPVMLPGRINISNQKNSYILFTGSFDFYPNQHAFTRLIEIAKANKKIDFVVAGRKLYDFLEESSLEVPENIAIESDVSKDKMESLYQNASVFLCPVYYGSGMKTKIAEALSYNVFCVADAMSTFGYKEAIEAGVVIPVTSGFFDSPCIDALFKMQNTMLAQANVDSIQPYDVFEKYYSLNSGIEIFRRVLQ